MKRFFESFDPDEWIRIFLGILFVGVGLLFTFIIGQVATLACNRMEDADRCVLRVNWMGLSPLKEIPIEGLNGARVEESCDDEGDCTYRVLLITSRQALPLQSAYSSGRVEKEEIAAQINAFALDKTIPNLSVSQGGGFWVILPLGFIAVGIFLTINPLKHAFRNLFLR